MPPNNSSYLVPALKQIEEAVDSIPGWSPLDQLLALYTLTAACSYLDGDVLELGSWCGRSAVALGLAARLTGTSRLHCVDLWPEKKDWWQNSDGSFSFAVEIDGQRFQAYTEQTVWKEPFERDIAPVYDRFSGTYEAFRFFVEENGLQDSVAPFKGNLATFSDSMPSALKIRLAFIDGDHSERAVAADIAIIERYLLPGGWICFDDAFSTYAGVNSALQTHIVNSGKYDICQQLTRKLFVARKI